MHSLQVKQTNAKWPGMFWTAEGCVTLAGAFRVQFDPLVGQLIESNPCFPSESIRLVSAFFPPGLFGALLAERSA